VCNCGRPKYFNHTPEVDPLGRSVLCEMNKFDDMIAYLASNDASFEQVIIMDGSFDLLTRAWCVAELAEGFRIGIKQCLKIKSGQLLDEYEAKLRTLRVQDMKASRPEDIAEILAKIPDLDDFNVQVQAFIFDKNAGLLARWRNLDALEQLENIGLLARFHILCREDAAWLAAAAA